MGRGLDSEFKEGNIEEAWLESQRQEEEADAYFEELACKRQQEDEFSMFIDCVVKANIDNEQLLKILGVSVTYLMEKGSDEV